MSDSQQTGNVLYYGDNLDILRRHIKDESVDLVYLDPPFKSNQDYNVLFAEKNGSQSGAQFKAFEDTWHWDQSAAEACQEVVESGGKVSLAMQAFRTFLGDNDMMAYLAMMAPRLIELRRILKSTGSIYLHCDPTASHYLKLLMDAIFDPRNFRNEIIWRRTTTHSDARRCGNVHDVILLYAKTDGYIWNQLYQPYSQEYITQYYRYVDEDGRHFMSGDLTGAGDGPPRVFGGRGKLSPPPGRHWMYDQEGIDKCLRENKIFWTRNNIPRLKVYLDEAPGMRLQDVWDDLQALRSWHDERLGYPTQKPESLLERIIAASSNTGDLVLDPFCGCGTTIAVAQRLNRRWIGIDITHLAVTLMKNRLNDSFGGQVSYQVIGEPVDITGGASLAKEDPYQFQWWALGLVNARPVEQKKGSDKGIDGRLYFHDEGATGQTKQIIFSVKAGKTMPAHVMELRGVVERESAAIGVLISFEEPTRNMRKEAASAGFYHSTGWNKDYPRLQLITVKELLEGKKIDYPPSKEVDVTYKKAPKAAPTKKAKNKDLFTD